MASRRVPILFVDFTTGDEMLAFYDASRVMPNKALCFDWAGRRMKTIVPANASETVAMYFVKIQAITDGGVRGVCMIAIEDDGRANRILTGKICKEVKMRHLERLKGAPTGRTRTDRPGARPSRLSRC